MKQTVYLSDFRDAFTHSDHKEQFSYEALGVLFDHIKEIEDDLGEEIEFDMLEICCNYTETTADEIANDFDIELSSDESKHRQEVIAHLSEMDAYVGETSHGTIIYREF